MSEHVPALQRPLILDHGPGAGEPVFTESPGRASSSSAPGNRVERADGIGQLLELRIDTGPVEEADPGLPGGADDLPRLALVEYPLPALAGIAAPH